MRNGSARPGSASSWATRAHRYTPDPSTGGSFHDDPHRGYPQDAFLDDLVDEAERDIRRCLDGGADSVQIDFTEGRLAVKLDPSKGLLGAFVDLNNRVISRFTDGERRRIGIHTCPGGDHD